MTDAIAKPKRAKKAANPAGPTEFVAYKGFDKNLQCRGYQYEVGKTYVHTGKVKRCDSGFHACQNPLDVLDFYPLENGNRFAKVTMRGQVDRSDDRKWAAAELTVDVELTFPAFVTEVIRWAWDACKADASVEGNVTSGKYATNASSGDYATNASSGDYATNASSGDYAKNASSGDYATNASSGDYAKNASSGDSAKNASSGDYAKNASSGDSAYNEATGQHSVISGAGRGTQYKGAVGVWISAAEYAQIDGVWRCIGFATGQAGHDGVPADTWLIAHGGKMVPA